jgi:hypothetical protein
MWMGDAVADGEGERLGAVAVGWREDCACGALGLPHAARSRTSASNVPLTQM